MNKFTVAIQPNSERRAVRGIEVIKLKTLDQFQNLKKGDFVIVKWSDYNIKHNPGMKKIMGYNIVENKTSERYSEIICRTKGNHFFNYKMLLEGSSGAEEVMLVKTTK